MSNVIPLHPQAAIIVALPHEPSRFEAFYAEWLKLQAALYNPKDKRSDKRINAANDRQDELAVLIAATPCSGAALAKKNDLLHHYMTISRGDERDPHIELILHAGIKADGMSGG